MNGADPIASRSPQGWAEPERILALQLYCQHGVIGRSHPAVLALSTELNRLALHPDAGTRANFRNANGVALKLANFASLDPGYPGRGMSGHSIGDRETWDRYSGDTDLLDEAAAAIRMGTYDPSVLRLNSSGGVLDETAAGSSELGVQVPPTWNRKAELEVAFRGWLRTHGHTVSSRRYPQGLVVEFFDESDCTIWVSAATVSRSLCRTMVGRLLDLRRYETPPTSIGMLLPWAPNADLLAFIASVPAIAAWPDQEAGFTVVGLLQR